MTGSSKAPKAPDYKGAAQAQGEADLKLAKYNTAMDRPNQYSPYGSTTWEYDKTAAQKVYDEQVKALEQQHLAAKASRNKKEEKRTYDLIQNMYSKGLDSVSDQPGLWKQITSLSPQEQQIFDREQANRNLMQSIAGTVGGQLQNTLGTAFNPNLTDWKPAGDRAGANVALPQADFRQFMGNVPTNTLTGLQDVMESPDAFKQNGEQVRDALYQQLTRFNNERFGKQEEAERSRLANMGFQMGTSAYDTAMSEFQRAKNEAYDSAGLNATLAGGQEQSRLYADMLAGRNSNIGLRQGQFGQDMSRLNAMAGLETSQFGADSNRYQMDQSERDAAANYGLQQASQAAAQRSQQMQEELTRRGVPMNEIAALMSGSGVNMPTFQGFNQAADATAPDIMGATQANYQAKLNAANASNAGAQNWMNLAGTLGGSYLAGPGGATVGNYLGSLFK